MATNLIISRSLCFEVPANLIIHVLSLLIDRKISYEIKSVSPDKRFLTLFIRINLSKAYQRDAVPLIEAIVKG